LTEHNIADDKMLLRKLRNHTEKISRDTTDYNHLPVHNVFILSRSL